MLPELSRGSHQNWIPWFSPSRAGGGWRNQSLMEGQSTGGAEALRRSFLNSSANEVEFFKKQLKYFVYPLNERDLGAFLPNSATWEFQPQSLRSPKIISSRATWQLQMTRVGFPEQQSKKIHWGAFRAKAFFVLFLLSEFWVKPARAFWPPMPLINTNAEKAMNVDVHSYITVLKIIDHPFQRSTGQFTYHRVGQTHLFS